jgi:hypothetical protein
MRPLRHRRRKIEDWDDAEVKDGEHVRVNLLDSRRVSDALAGYLKCAGHRPGYYVPQPFTHDADDLADAREARAKAFDDLCKRSSRAWMSDAQRKQQAEGDDDSDPEAARERAYQQAVKRSQDAWKMNSSAANAVEAQRRRWQGGK